MKNQAALRFLHTWDLYHVLQISKNGQQERIWIIYVLNKQESFVKYRNRLIKFVISYSMEIWNHTYTICASKKKDEEQKQFFIVISTWKLHLSCVEIPPRKQFSKGFGYTYRAVRPMCLIQISKGIYRGIYWKWNKSIKRLRFIQNNVYLMYFDSVNFL